MGGIMKRGEVEIGCVSIYRKQKECKEKGGNLSVPALS